MLRSDKQHIYYFSLSFLSVRLSNSLWGSDVLLFSEFINIASILFYNFIEFIILLYTFLVIYFAQHKKYITCLIWFSKFSDVLPAFTSASTIGNLWSICLIVHILRCLRSDNLRSKTSTTRATRPLATRSKILVSPFPCFSFGNIPFSKALRTFCFPLRSIIPFLRVSTFFSFLNDSFCFVNSLKISISSLNIIWNLLASSNDKSLL